MSCLRFRTAAGPSPCSMRKRWMVRISSMMRSKMRRTASWVMRAAIDAGHVGEHLVFALGLVDRQPRLALHAADVLHHARALVQQSRRCGGPLRRSATRNSSSLARASSCVMRRAPKPCFSSRAKDSSWISSEALSQVALDQAHERAAHHHARPPAGPTSATCSGFEMPKPTASGRSVMARMARTSGATASGKRIPLAGDAGARNQVDEAGGILRHQLQPPLGAGGRGQEDRVEAVAVHGADVFVRLFHARRR